MKDCKYRKFFPGLEVLCVNICEKYPEAECCVGCIDFSDCDIKCRQAVKITEMQNFRPQVKSQIK